MTDARHRDELSPSYSWYIRDWRASHRVSNLSWKERGFYRECLDWSWDLDGLPNDLEFIRDHLKATKGDFKKLWPAAARPFYEIALDERFRNARQEIERQKLHAFLRRCSDGGKSTAGIRRRHTPSALTDSSEQESPPVVAPAGGALLLPSLSPLPLPSLSLLPKEHERESRAETVLTERAARLREELYPQWYTKWRGGAKLCLVANHLEFQGALGLVRTWDDQRLERLAQIVLTTDEPFIATTDRSFKIFAIKASWADDRLRQIERGSA